LGAKTIFATHHQYMVWFWPDKCDLLVTMLGKIIRGHRPKPKIVDANCISTTSIRSTEQPDAWQTHELANERTGTIRDVSSLHCSDEKHPVELEIGMGGKGLIEVGNMQQLQLSPTGRDRLFGTADCLSYRGKQ
jgi:hypothetical protein